MRKLTTCQVFVAFVFSALLFSSGAISQTDITYPVFIFDTHFHSQTFADLYATVMISKLNASGWFEWGTIEFDHRSDPQVINNDAGNPTMHIALNNLTPSTTYKFRVVLDDGTKLVKSDVDSFTTRSPGGPPEPIVLSADHITSTTARLRGKFLNDSTVLGNYAVVFRWRNDLMPHGNFSGIDWQPQIQGGQGDTYVYASLTGLVPNSVYHYRLFSSNNGPADVCCSFSEELSFRTLPSDDARGIIIPILFTINRGLSYVRYFGVHSYATDCLDIAFGEQEMPPPPPDGFWPRFISFHPGQNDCMGLGSVIDIHHLLDTVETYAFRIIYQWDDHDSPVTVSWPSLDSLVYGDAILQQGIQKIDMKKQRSFVINTGDFSGFVISLQRPNISPLAHHKITSEPQLQQNYPNPFNATTIIRYAVPKAGHIKLLLYDLLGRIIQTLVDEPLEAGSHQLAFDAKDLPSGVYYYALAAPNYYTVRKLILLK